MQRHEIEGRCEGCEEIRNFRIHLSEVMLILRSYYPPRWNILDRLLRRVTIRMAEKLGSVRLTGMYNLHWRQDPDDLYQQQKDMGGI